MAAISASSPFPTTGFQIITEQSLTWRPTSSGIAAPSGRRVARRPHRGKRIPRRELPTVCATLQRGTLRGVSTVWWRGSRAPGVWLRAA